MSKFNFSKLVAMFGLAISASSFNLSSYAYEMPGVAYFEVPENFNLVQVYQSYNKQESVIAGKDLKNLDQDNLNKYFPFKLDQFSTCQSNKSKSTDNFVLDSDDCAFPEDLYNELDFQAKDNSARLEIITVGTGNIPSGIINTTMNFVFNNSFIRNNILDLIKESKHNSHHKGNISINNKNNYGDLEDIKTGILNGEKVFVFVFKSLDPDYKAYPHSYLMIKFNHNNFSMVSSFAKTKELANSNLVYLLNHFRYDSK